MNDADRGRYLRFALRLFAVVFVLGVYPLTVLWPSGWCWNPGQSEYLQMIIGIYTTLGAFLWLASNDPEKHRSLISFTIWSRSPSDLSCAGPLRLPRGVVCGAARRNRSLRDD